MGTQVQRLGLEATSMMVITIVVVRPTICCMIRAVKWHVEFFGFHFPPSFFVCDGGRRSMVTVVLEHGWEEMVL